MTRLLTACLSSAALLAACTNPSGRPPAQSQVPSPQAAVAPSPVQRIPPLTLESYKKAVAERIAQTSPDIFAEPLPEMFKSIVVLDITIARDGSLAHVAVRRSNGFKELEDRAMESVKRAAPFRAPALTVRGRDGSVSFLETFLFRNDGRFRIRSLVEQS